MPALGSAPTDVRWSFDSETAAGGASAAHTFTTVGEHTVTADYTGTGPQGPEPKHLTKSFYTFDSSDQQVFRESSQYFFSAFEKVPNYCNGVPGSTVRTAANSGNWSDAAVWGGTALAAGETAVIPSGVTVQYDSLADSAFGLKTVCVRAGGTLTFSTSSNTRLRVQNLLVAEGGTLQIGAPDAPLPPQFKAEIIFLNQAIDTAFDPSQYGNGLLAMGNVRLHGSPLNETFMRLAVEPRVGDTTLQLLNPVTGWQNGDRLVIPDTRQLNYVFSENWNPPSERQYSQGYETPRVGAVSPDGKTVTLSEAVKYDAHRGARDGLGRLRALPVVANLTRNIVVRSESALGVRGHTFFSGRGDVDIRYTQFAGLGRTTNNLSDDTTIDQSGSIHVGTNQRGRHPVYFSFLIGSAIPNSSGYQFRFIGNSVFCPLTDMETRPFKWGVGIDRSSFGLLQDNVVYNWVGGGIVSGSDLTQWVPMGQHAAGGERNRIHHNLVMRVHGVGEAPDSIDNANQGYEGAAYWIRGPLTEMTDNLAIENHVGYDLVLGRGTPPQTRSPLFPGADPTKEGQFRVIEPRTLPLVKFENNETGNADIGFYTWQLGISTERWLGLQEYASGVAPTVGGESVIKNLKIWHPGMKGIYSYEERWVTYDGLEITGDLAALASGHGCTGMYAGDYSEFKKVVKNFEVHNCACGLAPSGLTTPIRYEHGIMSNYNDFCWIPQWNLFAGDTEFPRTVDIDDVSFIRTTAPTLLDLYGPQQNFNLDSRYSTMIGDGNPGASVVKLDKINVHRFNGVEGDDFNLFYNEAAWYAILPQTHYYLGQVQFEGCPEANMTNRQCYAAYGRYRAAQPLPTTAVRRPRVTNGFVAPLP